MRIISARAAPYETQCSAMEAIHSAKKADSELRTVSDVQIRGKMVREVSWDDCALVFDLDYGEYLNIVAERQGITCSIGRTAIVASGSMVDDQAILLELDGQSTEWRRDELSRKFLGQSLWQLWFGDNVLYVYFEETMISCHLLKKCVDDSPMLFWTESD